MIDVWSWYRLQYPGDSCPPVGPINVVADENADPNPPRRIDHDDIVKAMGKLIP